MSLLNAMYSGVSGLSAESDALNVVGDNVANSNTVGFKQSRAVFENMLSGTSNVSDMSGQFTGAGVRVQGTQQLFSQGSMQNTGQNTDIALQGDGFFVVQGSVSGNQGTFYTRAGQTHLDKDGTLVNPDGLKLQGYPISPDGTVSSAMSNIQLKTSALSPQKTTALSVSANLNSGTKVSEGKVKTDASGNPVLDASGNPTPAAFDPASPTATSDLSTSLKVYDSLGNAHDVNVYFQKSADGQWTYHALANNSELTGGTGTGTTEIGTGTLKFNTDGSLQTVTGSATANFNGADQNQALKFNFGTPKDQGGTGLDGITQFGSASNVSSQKSDGYASGDLSGISIGADGTVNGVYTNGQSIPVARLAVAKFTSNDGLARSGQNLWSATSASGAPAMAAAGSGGRGSLVSGSLEQSNVDVATQFVDLITHQRSFQANSKTITTADQMLQELMNIKQ